MTTKVITISSDEHQLIEVNKVGRRKMGRGEEELSGVIIKHFVLRVSKQIYVKSQTSNDILT